jgi:hypothetical protein
MDFKRSALKWNFRAEVYYCGRECIQPIYQCSELDFSHTGNEKR